MIATILEHLIILLGLATCILVIIAITIWVRESPFHQKRIALDVLRRQANQTWETYQDVADEDLFDHVAAARLLEHQVLQNAIALLETGQLPAPST